MHRDSDFDVERPLPANADALAQDLELNTLWSAMAADDPLLFEVAKRALLGSLLDPDEIVYRQQILADCLEHASTVRDIYELTGEALQAQKSVWGGLSKDSPQRIVSTSVQKLELLVGFLRRLREIADRHAAKFRSPGFDRFFAMVTDELDEQYLEAVENQLKALKFKGGMLLSAQLTTGNKGTGYMLREPRAKGLLQRVFDRSGHSFTIPERDDNGFRALSDLEERGVNRAANALAQSLDHVLSFVLMLRTEIGFYVGCLNLSERLAHEGEPTCLPHATSDGDLVLSATGLYDICLTLTIERRVVGNDLDATGKSLVLITGANQGGKSTFLRSLGVAQLMAQSGMFVGAQSLRLKVADGLFTHFKREEDEAMESGKLDEELARMSEIADQIAPGCVLLCNESFASTNEREGSEIARHVISAMLAAGIRVVFVTHMFDLANGFYEQDLETALFLRAQRQTDGARPFKLSESRPLATSYGEDSYRRIFGRGIETAAAPGPDSGRR